jgi:hypothetical protein
MHSFSDPGTETARFQRRVAVARALTLICFGLIAARLFYLQVRQYSSLSAKAERNSTAIVPTRSGARPDLRPSRRGAGGEQARVLTRDHAGKDAEAISMRS